MTLIILGLISVGLICFFAGKQSGSSKAYWKGRGEGWKACEDMVVGRAAKSEKINLSPTELWEELIQ